MQKYHRYSKKVDFKAIFAILLILGVIAFIISVSSSVTKTASITSSQAAQRRAKKRATEKQLTKCLQAFSKKYDKNSAKYKTNDGSAYGEINAYSFSTVGDISTFFPNCPVNTIFIDRITDPDASMQDPRVLACCIDPYNIVKANNQYCTNFNSSSYPQKLAKCKPSTSADNNINNDGYYLSSNNGRKCDTVNISGQKINVNSGKCYDQDLSKTNARMDNCGRYHINCNSFVTSANPDIRCWKNPKVNNDYYCGTINTNIEKDSNLTIYCKGNLSIVNVNVMGRTTSFQAIREPALKGINGTADFFCPFHNDQFYK